MSDALSLEDLEVLDHIVAETIEPVSPPSFVRAKVLAAITPRALDESLPGAHESFTLRADDGKWKTIVPGARTKKLSKDARRGTFTCLLELEPNTILPAHDHQGGEESYVIRGSCRIGGVALYAGDFHRVEEGAHHGDVVASAEGCLLLVTADLADVA